MTTRIATFIKRYLLPSEPFIYEEIRSLKDFETIILCKRMENLDLFPTPVRIFQERANLLQRWRERLGNLLLTDHLDKDFFREILLVHKVRLIHAHFAYGGMMILPLSKELGLPLITTLYGIDVSRFARHPLYRLRLTRLFGMGNLFLAQSRTMKDEMEDLGCPEKKIVAHYLGVDIEKFMPKDKRIGKEKKILMCGRFVEKKGFEYGIRAFARLFNSHRDIVLVIIGYGGLEGRLRRLVKTLGIEERVNFLGLLSYDRYRDELAMADIFLSPNLTSRDGDREGQPNVIKEAMACGLPVVSTHHAGIPEVVEEGKTGFLVRERETEGLVERLDHLIRHPEIGEEMGRRGREIVVERFNLKRQTRILEGYYRGLIGD